MNKLLLISIIIFAALAVQVERDPGGYRESAITCTNG